VFKEYFQVVQPARTTVEAAPPRKGVNVEIDAVASGSRDHESKRRNGECGGPKRASAAWGSAGAISGPPQMKSLTELDGDAYTE